MYIPEWFIKSIVNEEDKNNASKGLLKGNSVVKVRCNDCQTEFDVTVNSCVKTRNKYDNNHILKCRSCSLRKNDIKPGSIFGNLTVIDIDYKNNKARCLCSCGNESLVFINNLRSGRTSSCGNHKVDCLYYSCIHKFKMFLDSIHIDYICNSFIKDIDCEIDFLIKLNKDTILVNFYGEHSVRSKNKDPYYLFTQLTSFNNYRLVNIFVNDYLNNVSKFNCVFKDLVCETNRIYARNCIVKPVLFADAMKFFSDNHLQGSTRLSKINYGLYYNNELYAVMGFGSSNYHLMKNAYCNDYFDKTRYELHRYAVKLGFSVIGGCSKLLKHFEREHSPSYILSYSSNDWFSGNMYEILGFTFSGITAPRYYWVKGSDVLNRESCQLKKLNLKYPELISEAYSVNAKNKETYIMSKLGFTKVFTSGNKKWEKVYR